jgi:hypothetical protein
MTPNQHANSTKKEVRAINFNETSHCEQPQNFKNHVRPKTERGRSIGGALYRYVRKRRDDDRWLPFGALCNTKVVHHLIGETMIKIANTRAPFRTVVTIRWTSSSLAQGSRRFSNLLKHERPAAAADVHNEKNEEEPAAASSSTRSHTELPRRHGRQGSSTGHKVQWQTPPPSAKTEVPATTTSSEQDMTGVSPTPPPSSPVKSPGSRSSDASINIPAASTPSWLPLGSSHAVAYAGGHARASTTGSDAELGSASFLPIPISQADEGGDSIGGSDDQHPADMARQNDRSVRYADDATPAVVLEERQPVVVEKSPLPQDQLVQVEPEDLERQGRQPFDEQPKDDQPPADDAQNQSQQQQQQQRRRLPKQKFQQRENDRVAGEPTRCRSKVIFYGALSMILLILIVAVGITVYCATGRCSEMAPSKNKNSADDVGGDVPPATKTPTMTPRTMTTPTTPTSTVEAQTREEMIAILINDRTLTENTIRYPPPPENAPAEEEALSWLINDDPASLNSTEPNRLLVRFFLAVLWYGQIIPRVDTFAGSWLVGDDECSWAGIRCGQPGVVDSIRVDVNNTVAGRIPSDIGLLTALTDLVLITNALTGSIPGTISRLTNLINLNLEQNKLTGSIPSRMSALTKLTRLSIFDNALIGSIPNILLMSSLQSLELYSNGLVGTIPSYIGVLTSLTYLGLHENAITGTIPNLGWLSRLQTLALHNNELDGTIPSSMASLTSLTTLSLFGNPITGTIPTELQALTALEYAYLFNMGLNGTVPLCSSSSNLTLIKDLVVDCNKLDCPCCTACCPASGWNNKPGWTSSNPDMLCR